MNIILNKIKALGYNFEHKQNLLNVYKANEKGFISEEIYFSINSENEIYKIERNQKVLIGKYDSLEFCLLILLFKFNSYNLEYVKLQQLKEHFLTLRNMDEILTSLEQILGKEFVSNNIFSNRDFSEGNGFYLNLSESDNNLSINFKNGNSYFLVASKNFEKKHLILPKLVELAIKKNMFDGELNNLGIKLDEQQYLKLFSNYCFGFSVMINEVKKNKHL